jgi:hypothetical protein
MRTLRRELASAGEPSPQCRGPVGALALTVGSTLLALLAAEALLAVGLRHPQALGGRMLPTLRRIHRAAEWPLVQFDAACARWDPEVTYTLRPPGCTVRDREFTVRYDVNTQGLRDDDRSLVAPAVIVLGDSYAMGWGVARDETFAARLEARLRVRVLNAGVSSYGTARALRLLARLDRRGLAALVLQWSWNDDSENRAWVEHDGALPITSREEYEGLVAAHARAIRYWPGKYLPSRARVRGGAHAAGAQRAGGDRRGTGPRGPGRLCARAHAPLPARRPSQRSRSRGGLARRRAGAAGDRRRHDRPGRDCAGGPQRGSFFSLRTCGGGRMRAAP